MLNILFEDDEIIVCIKPADISSQDSGDSSMPAILRNHTKSEYIAVIHRLDTAVSGVMVYAKTKAAAANLSAQIQNGIFKKEYLAVTINSPQANTGRYEDWLFKDSSKNKSYVVKHERKGVKKAILDYEKLKLVHLDNGDICLNKIHLVTGRTHQIRVQFSSRKMPLLGDKKYGSRFTCPIALFSHKITFLHPTNQSPLTFSALPEKTFPWNKFDM